MSRSGLDGGPLVDSGADVQLSAVADVGSPADVSPVDAPLGDPWWGSAAPPHSSTVVITADGRRAFAVQPDGDTLSVVNLSTATLETEIALGPTPVPDAAGRYLPAIAPASIALAPGLHTAFVACERSGEVVALDTDTLQVVARVHACTRPVGVLVRGDEAAVYVSCAAEDTVLSLDAATLLPIARAAVIDRPWALGLSADGTSLYVSHLTVGTVDVLDAVTLAARTSIALPDVPPRGHPLLAHGVGRGFLDVAVQPITGLVWVPHTLLATDTPQPTLDFETTVFPAVSIGDPAGSPARVVYSDSRLEGVDGAFRDVVSGPRALAFLPGSGRVLVVARNSEAVLVLDPATGNEVQFVGDLPGTLPDGVAITPDGTMAYINARNGGVLIPLAIASDGTVRLTGSTIPTRAVDPMPATYRRGQWVFHTANDQYEAFPITTNDWVCCESCHLAEGSTAVTFQLSVGPRDPPSLHAGLDGFLMHTALRTSVLDFWRTINTEQGGEFFPDDQVLGPDLDALRDYVTLALAEPPPPPVDPVSVAKGREVFNRGDVGCATCHTGPRFTDSGAGNPSLNLAGPVLLHDVGTCTARDRPSVDIEGHSRGPCAFDTPTLHGLADSPPYLHDGSAATLLDVLTVANRGDGHGHTSHLSQGELDALVDFLRSL